MADGETLPQKPASGAELARYRQPGWNEIGESFETMGKIGLALAVGLSAAGLFCRLADQGKVKIPSLSQLVAGRSDDLPRSDKKERRAPDSKE